MHEATLKQRESKLGPDHPDTLTSRNNLAAAYLAAGRTDDAIKMHEETLKHGSRSSAPTTPTRSSAATTSPWPTWPPAAPTEAIKLHEETLKLRESKLGPDHPDTLISRRNLANGLPRRRPARPGDLAPRAGPPGLRAKARPGPSRYPHVPSNSWPTLTTAAGQYAKAEPLLRDALERARKQFGPADPRTAAAMAALGSNLIQQRKWVEAEPILRECLAIREKAQPDDWSTFNTRSQLGGSLLGQKKFADAEPLILAGYEGMKAREAKIPAPGKPRLTEAAERVVQLYEAWGKTDQAAEWKRKLGLADLPADVFARP